MKTQSTRFLTTLSLILMAFPALAEWKIEDFMSALKAQKYKSIEAAIASLPVEMRASYVPMYESHGLRGATPMAPSIIMFSNSGKGFLAFGARNMAMGNAIEMARFDETTKRIEMSEAVFTNEDQPNAKVDIHTNPKACMACHGEKSRLLWQGYLSKANPNNPLGGNFTLRYKDELVRSWLGSFGSYDDQLPYSRTTLETSQETVDAKAEMQRWSDFWNSSTKDSRYKHLLLGSEIPGIPEDAATVDETEKNTHFHMGTGDPSDDVRVRPNLRMTSITIRLNALSRADHILNHSEFKKDPVGIISAFVECTPGNTGIRAALAKLDLTVSDFNMDILEPIAGRDSFPFLNEGGEINGIWPANGVTQEERLKAVSTTNSINNMMLSKLIIDGLYTLKPEMVERMKESVLIFGAGEEEVDYFYDVDWSKNFFLRMHDMIRFLDIGYFKKHGGCEALNGVN